MTSRVARLAIVVLTASLWSAPVVAEAAPKKKLGAVVGPVRLVANGGDPITVPGLHEFLGTVVLEPTVSGLLVVNRLPLERYLLGLAEVPVDWPEEALKAQAVAARTYALWTLSRPPAGEAAVYGYDICATVQCQVFAGADVVTSDGGERWAQAVRDTAGVAVLYDGRPILARYHSVSGGMTFDNPDAFPGEPAYPYLQSVPSTTEEASPLYRWEVRFTLERVERMLQAWGWWPPEMGKLIEVRTVPPRGDSPYPNVRFTGKKDRLVRTAEEFRTVVRELAPRFYPALYPSPAVDLSSGRLPETLPSERVSITTDEKLVLVEGRGWGHGTGMSQWGAHGLAEMGVSYPEILTHYYTGTTVGRVDYPGDIEVGVATGESSVTATGDFRIVDGRGKTLVRRAIGTWNFRWTGSGSVSIDPPQGFGLPLKVGIVEAPRTVEVGEATYLTIALSRPAKVQTLTSAPTGFDDPGSRVEDAGQQRIAWLAPLEPGHYRVAVRASTGAVARKSEFISVVVEEASLVDPNPESDDDGKRDRGRRGPSGSSVARGDEQAPGRHVPLATVALVLLLAVGAAAVAGTMRW